MPLELYIFPIIGICGLIAVIILQYRSNKGYKRINAELDAMTPKDFLDQQIQAKLQSESNNTEYIKTKIKNLELIYSNKQKLAEEWIGHIRAEFKLGEVKLDESILELYGTIYKCSNIVISHPAFDSDKIIILDSSGYIGDTADIIVKAKLYEQNLNKLMETNHV